MNGSKVSAPSSAPPSAPPAPRSVLCKPFKNLGNLEGRGGASQLARVRPVGRVVKISEQGQHMNGTKTLLPF